MIGRSGEVVESLIELFVGNTANCTLMASLLGAIDLPLPCNICYLKKNTIDNYRQYLVGHISMIIIST